MSTNGDDGHIMRMMSTYEKGKELIGIWSTMVVTQPRPRLSCLELARCKAGNMASIAHEHSFATAVFQGLGPNSSVCSRS